MPDEPSAILVHLSDLHFAADNPGLEERNALVRERLCSDLELLLKQIGRRADAVLVTGDIAFGGKQAEYDQAARWFEQVIDPITNGSTRLLCVPGNHDVDWDLVGPTHEAHRRHIASQSEEQLDALLDRYLAEDGQAILHPLGRYNEFASSLDCQIEDHFHWDTSVPIGGAYQLDFRGVTTVINSYKTDGAGTLAVHANQLLYTPAAGHIPVLLAHHDPYFWRRHHRLQPDVAARMSLALYGHTHSPRVQKVEECLEVTGGAVQPQEGKDWMPSYNVLRLTVGAPSNSKATLTVEVWRRRFSLDHDRFIPDTATGDCDRRDVAVLAAPPVAEGRPQAVDGDSTQEEARVALTTPEGRPHPVREVQRALYGLGAGDRIGVLIEIGVPVDDLARLPAHRLIPQAAELIVGTGKLDEFRRAVADRGSST